MSYISKNKQSFGKVAKDYKKYRGSYTDALYKKLLSLKGEKEGISILDLGCGVGNSTEPILRMAEKMKINATVAGCDPDPSMLKEARLSAKKNKLPITYVEGSAEKLPFGNNSFNLIVSGAAFHWFANKKAMKEIQRVLKSNGMYFVFWTQNVKSKKPVIGNDLYREYKFKGIPKELRDPMFVKKLFIQSGFLKVKIGKTPYVESKPIKELVGIQKTNSGYAVLSLKDKKEFIKKLTKEYKNALGEKKEVLKQEIHICYGYK